MPRALLLLALGCLSPAAAGEYFGAEIGALSELHHGVSGKLFAVDSRTLYLRDFSYDGEGPAAYFYVGLSGSPGAGGVRLRDERGGAAPLRRYRAHRLTLALPEGTALKDVKWFAVWCDDFSVNFGSAAFPAGLAAPRAVRVGALRGVHGVSSDPIVVVDAQTLLVPNFSYDGEAPDAKFWVGRGAAPSPQGIRIPDENGKEAPLRKYERKTIVLTLPGELSVHDIGHVAVWCEAFTVNFGHVELPRRALRAVPPSLRMLGVAPQSKLNCEVLHEELGFEVRWAVAGDSIVLQLVAKLEEGEYMSFGLSGSAHRSQMVGGDVAVAWVEPSSLRGAAVDYYLDAKSQCAGVSGSCPDDRLVDGTNSLRMLNAALVSGYSIVTYQRALQPPDSLDRAFLTNTSQPVIWALGPLNSRDEVSYHQHFTKGDKFLEFGRPPVWNCPMPEGEEEQHAMHHVAHHKEAENITSSVLKARPVPPPRASPRVKPWEIPAIQCYEPEDGVFYAQMGPTGGKRGYPAITGHVGWGISWYINGLLIPEIQVVRGRTYTFVAEGGRDPAVPARYHPFYITNDPVGGYFHKTDDEKKGVEIYAGVRRGRAGEVEPTGAGRLCHWTPAAAGAPADDYPSFGAYQRSLTLVCDPGDPAVVTWTPDASTPDTVYYQCFTHRHLGWKINVLDECDEEGQESRQLETVLAPPGGEPALDQASVESVQVHSRHAPRDSLDQKTKLEKIINTKHNYDNFSTNGLTGEVYQQRDESALYAHPPEYEAPVSAGQIAQVIQAVESIESDMKDDAQRGGSAVKPLGQYQVHEEVKEMFIPERPIRENEEYVVETGKVPETYFLPPNQKPLTLQSVLRPGGPKPGAHGRPHFRRPAPPEIKMRRPPPMFQKVNGGYPLPMPTGHGPHTMQKKPQKHPNNRLPPNMNRPPMGSVPPMKSMPSLHPPPFGQIQHKQPPKAGPAPAIVLGKPVSISPQVSSPAHSQTLSLAQTDIIANQVVKSQITLPGSPDAVAQHSSPQTYHTGQIILGKPMEHPQPLDQQMIQTKPQNTRAPPTPPPHAFQAQAQRVKLITHHQHPAQNEIKSSDFIGESAESTSVRPALNTGFKPDSIVVESGFKPIIREPLMAAEDRIAEYEGSPEPSSNRREDTDVEEDYDESPQIINHQYSSERLTQSFEPMFIPSPEDHLLPTDDRTKEVFPKNHAKEDRPHPVYIKTESELNALFGKKNMNRHVPDMVMESDRVSPQYLPPDPKLPKEHSQKLSAERTFTTYDGKTVSAATLTSVPDVNKTNSKIFSSKLPANTELLLKSPQFGPFRGEIPPPVPGHAADSDARLPDLNSRVTKLKLVNLHKPDTEVDDLTVDGSEKHQVSVKKDHDVEEDEQQEEYEEEEEEEERREEETNKRSKRENKATEFDSGEVEQVRTNGHTLVRSPAEGGRRAGSAGAALLPALPILPVLALRPALF